MDQRMITTALVAIAILALAVNFVPGARRILLNV